jgi:hypothetical protein
MILCYLISSVTRPQGLGDCSYLQPVGRYLRCFQHYTDKRRFQRKREARGNIRKLPPACSAGPQEGSVSRLTPGLPVVLKVFLILISGRANLIG